MAGVNKVILIGNLGRDPELKYLEGNVARANFSLATSDSYKDKNGNRVDQTEWHNIVMWRGLAESAEKYLKKGTQVYIEGKLQTRQWNDKDGHKRNTTEIVAESYVILQRRDAGNTGNEGGNDTSFDKQDSGDLPF
ncbi:MAG: single-stranded DNA-binding protein [Bacteroidia bacterium]|jgi:single-strand DNA-binding protein|nr:single-stranded DNA-binding protein [Bacteroidia bacterium]